MLALCAAFILGSGALHAQEAGQGPGLVWRYASDGSWIADAISVGNHGTQVFTEFGSVSNSAVMLSAHDADPPAPVWVDPNQTLHIYRVVASSREHDVHVAMHQQPVPGSTSIRRAVLRKYSSASGTHDWSRQIPVDIIGHSSSTVAVTRDGQRIVAAVYDSAVMRTRVEWFGPGSATPFGTYLVDTQGAFRDFSLSPDGSRLLLVSNTRLQILNVEGGAVVYTKQLFGAANFGAVGFSGDGTVAAYGTVGEVWILERNSNGAFVHTATLTLPAETFCRRLGISENGSTLAAGLTHMGFVARASVRAYDLPTRSLQMTHVLEGAGSYQNAVERISVSRDGSRFAVGLWGDEGGLVPEVLLYERDRNEPVFSYDLPGSVNALDLSPRGDYLAVASKGVHANVAGGGGAFWLFRTGASDLGLEGVPSIGCGVALAHRLGVGESSRVLVAPFLAAQPETFGPAGTLYLDRMSMRFLAGTRVAGADGAARHPVAIPGDSTLIGTSLYYQGLHVGARRLSGDWVKMTVLP